MIARMFPGGPPASLLLVLAVGLAVTMPARARADAIDQVIRAAEPTAAFVGRTPKGAFIVFSRKEAYFVRVDRKLGLVAKRGPSKTVNKLIKLYGWCI